MANAKTSSVHTPGPWLQDTVVVQQYQSDREPISTALITTREGDSGFCRHVALAYGATKPECEANVRLIAAAPKLLEACEHTLDTLLSLAEHPAFADNAAEFNRGGYAYESCELLESAIAKAKGKAA